MKDALKSCMVTTCVIVVTREIWIVKWKATTQFINVPGSALNDASLSAVVLKNVQNNPGSLHISFFLIMLDAASSPNGHGLDSLCTVNVEL